MDGHGVFVTSVAQRCRSFDRFHFPVFFFFDDDDGEISEIIREDVCTYKRFLCVYSYFSLVEVVLASSPTSEERVGRLRVWVCVLPGSFDGNAEDGFCCWLFYLLCPYGSLFIVLVLVLCGKAWSRPVGSGNGLDPCRRILTVIRSMSVCPRLYFLFACPAVRTLSVSLGRVVAYR